MSRIGKKPVAIPQGVEVKMQNRQISVKGPKGELNWEHPVNLGVSVEGGAAVVTRQNDQKHTKACHGLTRSLIQNMVIGVAEGYTRVMEIQGVGFRAQVEGDTINLQLGFSHPVKVKLPQGVRAEVDKKQTTITLNCIDKQLLGQVAADIRSLRSPDSYKGKGIRYQGERVRLKAGKSAK